jgi:nucleotide-binding universal stress UspA family protein
MSLVQREEDDMYFHALTGLDIDSKPYSLAATRAAARQKRRLLVAFDGSSTALCALEFAIGQAPEFAAIHVVNVQEPTDEASTFRSRQQAGEKVLRVATALMDLHGIPHAAEVAFGDVAEAIVRSALMERCDLIIVGTRDRLAIASFFSSSVSAQVARLAPVPVTVIKQKVVATTHSPQAIPSPRVEAPGGAGFAGTNASF